VAGPIRAVGPFAWQAADLVARFGDELMMSGAGLPWRASCRLSSAWQLAWGARYRPSPSEEYRTVCLPVNRFLARRTWMCLPAGPGPEPGLGPVIAEVPSTASRSRSRSGAASTKERTSTTSRYWPGGTTLPPWPVAAGPNLPGSA
jgi:hypothetical protein